MRKIQYPDYRRGLVNLTNSILQYFGAPAEHETLQELDDILNKKTYKNVVLMVFDGLGEYNINRVLAEESFLNRHKKAVISSVFPPTTTAATTSLDSGLLPCEHGWLGWSLHFDEVGDNVNLFPNTKGDGEERAAEFSVAGKYMPYENVLHKIRRAGQAKAESVAFFGSCYAEELADITSETARLCGEEGRHYIYTYYNEPDHTMHKTGVDSIQTAQHIAQINREVEKLSRQVEDTLILVTADHGHINCRNVWIGEYPKVAELLKYPPAIEPRAMALYVRDGEKEHFKEVFQETFREEFLLLSKEEVLKGHLFGEGQEHPRFRDFIGDYLAVATGQLAVFSYPGEAENFIGVHAGLTREEMMVPLIVIEG